MFDILDLNSLFLNVITYVHVLSTEVVFKLRNDIKVTSRPSCSPEAKFLDFWKQKMSVNILIVTLDKLCLKISVLPGLF